MTLVRSRLISLGTGEPAAGAKVFIRLVGPAGWLRDQSTQVTGTYETESDPDGWYEFEVPSQSSLEAEGTFYEVREWRNATWAIEVPESDEPVLLRDCLTNPPPERAEFSPISTFDSLRDVNPEGRDPGDLVAVGPDGRLVYVAQSASVAAPKWWTGDGPPTQIIVGASPNDLYYDRLNGDLYILE